MSKSLVDSPRGDQALARAEQQLRQAKEQVRQLQALVAAANVGLWDWDLRTNQVTYSSEWKRQIGYQDHEISDDFSEWQSRVHLDDLENTMRIVRSYVEKPWPDYRHEFRFRHRDGSYRWILTQASMALDERGTPARMLGSHIDITEQKRSEAILAAQHTQLTRCIDDCPASIAMFDREMRYLAASHRWCSDFGKNDLPIVGRCHYDVFPDIPARWKEIHRRCLAGAIERSEEDTFQREDGSTDWLRWEVRPWHTVHGEVGGIVILSELITERKRAEQASRDEEARLRSLIDGVPHIVGIVSPEEHVEYANKRWREYFGSDATWTTAADRLELVHPDDRATAVELQKQVREAIRERRAGLQNRDLYAGMARLRRCDGAFRWFSLQSVLVAGGPDKCSFVISTGTDIDEQKKSQDSLREAQADLLQSQKLESIGQLAGGVAHDFNNLLTIILGQASLSRATVTLPEPVADALRDIESAAERAADLTAQLLAFGRRQLLQLRVLDLNAAAADTLKMLTRVVGENVTMRFEPWAAALPVRADVTAITQILLNLTLNARDAMPQGGSCTVRTHLVDAVSCSRAEPRASSCSTAANQALEQAGPWVCLTVTDTGNGITPSVLPHIFDPFFTTKGIGKGSGLGLSTVYGLAKQHGGFVTVDTQLGQGSTFKVFLPRDESEVVAPTSAARSPAAGRGEQILVVEDEPGVRLLLTATLGGHGYKYVAAQNAAEALRVWREQGPVFDLLFTDMMMPGGMSGLELVDALRADKPSLKAIISSGYSPEVIGAERTTLRSPTFLQKPWTIEQLLTGIRTTLDADT